MRRAIAGALVLLGACAETVDDHTGLYASHDSAGFQAVSLEKGGRFQLLLTSARDSTFPVLIGGNYVVVGDSMYFRSDVMLPGTRVSAVLLRNDSLFWGSGAAADAFVREQRY